MGVAFDIVVLPFTLQGLKRNEQSALIDLFKVKAAATAKRDGQDTVPLSSTGGGILSMKKLDLVERLMRPRGDVKSNK